jgi:DNA polymerase/3'-5' exonuclease PolX
MLTHTLLYLFNKCLSDAKKAKPTSLRYIIMAYNNVSYKIKEAHALGDNITKKDIANLDITDNMKEKLTNLLGEKPSKKDMEKMKENKLRQELIDIAGIGKIKAVELMKLGLKDVKNLTQKKWREHLNTDTLTLIKYKPLKRIPNMYIRTIEKELTGFKGTKIVGGFLRKKTFSKDIDVMLVSNKKDALDKYVAYLKKTFKDVVVYSQGDDKMSLVIKPSKKYYKLDIFRSPTSQQHAMLLYSTGSKRFNIKMRGIAKRKGYLLNQMGIFKLPCNKDSKPIPVKSEKNIFKILDLPYINPENR